jgi:hypothetical protein
MSDGPMIDVLLATYRPQVAMLKAQVDSIRAQRGVDVNLICREDSEGLGVCGNFSALLAESSAEYAAFSDQDDVWDKDKLGKSLAKMHELEAIYGKDVPLLVFCDGYVTDAELNRKPGTVLSRQRVNIVKGLCFNRLLMQNFIAGNAMLFNAALRKKAGVVPVRALMHDAWLVLVAAAFGHVGFVNKPLYLYRQHGENVFGATDCGPRHFLRRALAGVSAFRSKLMANAAEAAAFVERFGGESPKSAMVFAALPTCGWLERRIHIVRHRLFKHGFLRNLSLLLFA